MQYLFFLFFVYFLIKNYKKGVVIYAPFKFFFYEGFQLGFVTFDIALSCIVCLFYLFKYKTIKTQDFPWKKSFWVLTISGIIYSLYPQFYLGELLRQLFCVYVYGYIFFCCLNDKTVRVFLDSCAVFVLLLAGNGFLALVTGDNLLGDYHNQFYSGNFHDNSLIRFEGFNRVRSFCSHPISYGVECAVFTIMFLCLYFFLKQNYFRSLYYVIILLGIIGIISSGSRTPLIGFIFMLIPLSVFWNKLTLSQKTIVFLSLMCFLVLFGVYIVEMVHSIINPEATSIQGSSITGRLEQFTYCIYLIKDNWLFGYGSTDIMNLKNADYTILYGSESIWMILLLYRGVFGVIAYIYFYIDVFKHLPSNNKKVFVFFVLGWLFIDSATSLMGINMFFPIMIMTLLYKMGNFDATHKLGYICGLKKQ